MNPQLSEYIKHQLESGARPEQVKESLISAGWPVEDIDKALNMSSGSKAVSRSISGGSLAPITTLIRRAWSLYVGNWTTLVVIALIPVVLTIVSAKLFSSNSATTFISILEIVLTFVLFVVQTWSYLALLFVIKDKVSIREAYSQSRHKILSYWWLSILGVLVTFGGLALLIIPGIIVAVSISMSPFIMVSENIKGFKSLLKSRYYVKGNWGGVFSRLVLVGVLVALIGFLFEVLLSELRTGMIVSIAHLDILLWIGKIISALVVTPLVIGYTYSLYESLRSIKDDSGFTIEKKSKVKYITSIVIGIVAIPLVLIFVVSAAFGTTRDKSNDILGRLNITRIETGLELYQLDKGSYPASLSELSPDYILEVPLDPRTGQPYQYQKNSDLDYSLCAQDGDGGLGCTSPSDFDF